MSGEHDLLTKDVSDVVQRLLLRRSIDRHIGQTDDLREVGLDSMDMVDLVLSIESEFDVKIPETAITAANFRSISSIDLLVRSLRS